MAYDEELADRVREALADHAVREVKMFGGLSFMVDEKMVVSVRGNDELLVRADPAEADDLLERGAHRGEMGAGRMMNKGWLSVPRDGVEDREGFEFWMDVALRFNQKGSTGGRGARSRRKKA